MVANKKGHDSPTLLVRSVCDDTKRVETIGEGRGMGGGFGPQAAAVGSVNVAKLGANDELGCCGGHAVYRCTGDERGRYTAVSPDVSALGGGAKPRAVDGRGFMVMPQGLRGAVMNNTGNNGPRQLFRVVDPWETRFWLRHGTCKHPPRAAVKEILQGNP